MNLAKEGLFLDHADPRAGEPREAPKYQELPDSLQEAFAGLFDYAGFAPPANTDPQEVVSNYARYAQGSHHEMINVLVQRASYKDASTGEIRSDLDVLDEREAIIPNGFGNYSVLLPDPNRNRQDFYSALSRMAMSPNSESIASVEVPVSTPDDARSIMNPLFRFTFVDRTYIEVPSGDMMKPILEEIRIGRQHKKDFFAKLRTGGANAPTPEEVADFMVAAASRDIPFKPTGRLHHLVAQVNEQDGVQESGYLNAVLASALALRVVEGKADLFDVARLLREGDLTKFRISDRDIIWKDYVFPTQDIAADRQKGLMSIGSCSFEEPVQELARLRPAA